MNVGDMIKLCESKRKNGSDAGTYGLIVDFDKWGNPTVNINGKVKNFHCTQIKKICGAFKKETK